MSAKRNEASFEEERLQMVVDFMKTRGAVHLPTMEVYELWCLLSAVQLALKDPGFVGAPRENAEAAANELAKAVYGKHEGMKQLWEHGWQQQFDA